MSMIAVPHKNYCSSDFEHNDSNLHRNWSDVAQELLTKYAHVDKYI